MNYTRDNNSYHTYVMVEAPNPKGTFTYELGTEGEGELAQKQTIVQIVCAIVTVTRGKGGLKSRIFVRTSSVNGPY